MTTPRSTRIVTLLALLSLAAPAALLRPDAARAEADLHGFVEGAWGVRTAESSVHDDSNDFTLEETRAQLRVNAYGDVGEAFVRLDVLQDRRVSDTTDLELREGYLRFTTFRDKLDVKAGRQALTWGTGDLVFVNDLFPKDWESFFAGREDQYLKAPSDALRLGFYGLPFDVDLVVTPEFNPDRLPEPGGRYSNLPPAGFGGPAVLPDNTAGNMEWALRLSRYVGNFTASFYGYTGFFKTPAGAVVNPAHAVDPMSQPPYLPAYPELSVYGASLRGAVPGGVGWVEGGWYDSREDRDGTDPLVENSTVRYLAGYERQIWTDFNLTAQYYGEAMLEHDAYVASVGGEANAEDQYRHLWTLRAEQWLHYQTVRLSFFGFFSPTDEDMHLRLLASYKVSDDIEVAVGSNVFEGDSSTTMFGMFDQDDNVYTRLRMSF